MKRSDLFQVTQNDVDLSRKKSEGSSATSISETSKTIVEKNNTIVSTGDIASLSKQKASDNQEVISNVNLNTPKADQSAKSNSCVANEKQVSHVSSISEKVMKKRERDGISDRQLLRSFTRVKSLNAQQKEKQPEPGLSHEVSSEDNLASSSLYTQKEEGSNRDQYVNNQINKNSLGYSRVVNVEEQQEEAGITVNSKSHFNRPSRLREETDENRSNRSSVFSLLPKEEGNGNSSSEGYERFYEKRKSSRQSKFDSMKMFLQVQEKLCQNMKSFDIVSFKANLSFFKYTAVRKHKFSDSFAQCLAIFSEKNNAQVDKFFREEKLRLLEKTVTYDGWRLFQEKSQNDLANLKFSRFIFCYSFLKFFLETNLSVVHNDGEKYIKVARCRGFAFLRLSLLCLLPNMFACLLYSTDILIKDKRISDVSALAAIIFSSMNILLIFYEFTNYSIKPEDAIKFWHKRAREFNVNSVLLAKRGLFRQEATKLLQEHPSQNDYAADYAMLDYDHQNNFANV